MLQKPSKNIAMRSLVDCWTFSTAFFFLLLKIAQAIHAIFKPREDGWRRASRAYYRSEESKFVLGLHALKAPVYGFEADRWTWTVKMAHALRDFFATQAAAHVQLVWKWDCVVRRPKQSCDCAVAEYAPDGSLRCCEFVFDPGFQLPKWWNADAQRILTDAQRILTDALVSSFNSTCIVSDKARPRRLRQALLRRIRSERVLRANWRETVAWTDRLLNAIVVSSSAPLRKSDEERFEAPDFLLMKHPGTGPFHVHIRKSEQNEIDLFMQCSHIAIDGRPAAKMLDALCTQWGKNTRFLYPAGGFCTNVKRSTSAEKNALYHMQMYLDFAPLLKVRNDLSHRHKDIDFPLISLLGWALAQHDALKRYKILFPVELDASEKEQSLSFVSMRPSAYFNDGAPDKGFAAYQTEFNHQLRLTKARKSPSYEFLKTFTFAHPALYVFFVKLLPKAFENFIGAFGISVLKEAEYVVTPTCELFKNGAIAFGNLNLPSGDGQTVGIVSIKGTKEQVLQLKVIAETTISSIRELFCEL